MTRHSLLMLVATASLMAGCSRKQTEVPASPPDWRRYTVEGLSPMMSPDQVGRSLAAHGFVLKPCGEEPAVSDPLHHSTETICYEAPTRKLVALLNFKQLSEGRRLSDLSTNQLNGLRDDPNRRAEYATFLRHVLARWGRPTLHDGNTRLWAVPGASKTLPDNVTTYESSVQGPDVRMVSFWAYDHDIGERTGVLPRKAD